MENRASEDFHSLGSTRIMASEEHALFGKTHCPDDTDIQEQGSPTDTDLPILDDFEHLTQLGEGAMGKVYRARQISFDRDVALKVLRPHVAKNKKLVERLNREANTMFNLEHPNIVSAFAVNEVNGYHYVAMEFIDGDSLQTWLGRLGRFQRSRRRGHHSRLRPRLGICPPGKHHSPRYQTGQCAHQPPGHRQGRRLRHGQDARRRGEPDPNRPRRRHSLVYASGTGQDGQERRWPVRYLCPRLHVVLSPDRQSPLRGPDDCRRDSGQGDRHVSAGPESQSGCSRTPRSHHCQDDRQVAALPLSELRRTHQGFGKT